jgi:Insertion element 4 transposase N-terminal/Transposase DDE domain
LRVQSAIGSAVATITRTITVAAGVFAPGHLGELTRIVPFELIDGVLEEAGARERRLRLLPSRVGVYFLLAMCLFPQAAYLGVWGKLTAALDGLGLALPTRKALRDLRRRIGVKPVKALFEMLAGPLGQRGTPGIMFGRYRTVAFDGCRSIRVPDTERNRGWLGKVKASLGETGYPVIQLMTLVETGTRALLGAVFGSPADGETTWARKLLHLLDETMLVLMDRGFDAGNFLTEVAAAKAQFLVRLTATRRPPMLRHLPDGSFMSLIGGVKVRIIEASVTVTCHDGTRYGGRYRFATSLLDHRAYPAQALITLYHERWRTRGHLPRTAAHPAGRPGAALTRPGRRGAGDVGAAGHVPGAARRHHRRGSDRPGDRPRPGQLPDRRRCRAEPAHHRRRHHRPRRRPHRWHRPRRPGQPPPATPAPGLRPAGQVPAQQVEQAAAGQAPRQQEDHRDQHRDPTRPPAGRDTPAKIHDKPRWTLTPLHCP